MYIKDIETFECYFQHKRTCNFCCSNTNIVPSKLLLNLQHFYQDFRLSWRSFIGFCVYQVYREHRLSVFPFTRFCVYPIVSCVYPIVSCVNPILSCVYRVLSCIMSRITLRVLYLYKVLVTCDVKAKITNSGQSQNSHEEYKIKSWANTDPWTHQRWNQVPRRSKHPLLIDHTHREPIVLIRY